jgi:hypothetical protein
LPTTPACATIVTVTGCPPTPRLSPGGVHVTVCPDAEQPELDPAATNDCPAGNVSTTTGGAAASGPAFETVNVYVTFCPCKTVVGAADFNNDKSAAGRTSTDAIAVPSTGLDTDDTDA